MAVRFFADRFREWIAVVKSLSSSRSRWLSEHLSPFAAESFLNLWEAFRQAGKRQLFQAWLIETWAVGQQAIPNFQQRDLTSGVAASPNVGDVPNALPGCTCHTVIFGCTVKVLAKRRLKYCRLSQCVMTARSSAPWIIRGRGSVLS